jgi:triosephosphate isomerase
MLAFEVPELIASGKAISQYKSQSVKKFAQLVANFNKKYKTHIKALCGAGISNAQDVSSAVELGCDGVLVSSSIVKSKEPAKLLREMIECTK